MSNTAPYYKKEGRKYRHSSTAAARVARKTAKDLRKSLEFGQKEQKQMQIEQKELSNKIYRHCDTKFRADSRSFSAKNI